MIADDTGNLGDLIDLGRDGEKIAVIGFDEHGEPKSYTYKMLDEIASGVARSLTARGLRSGERVALFARNSPLYLGAYLGIMRAGFVAVPVNTKFPRVLTDFLLSDSGAKFVFCDRAHEDLVSAETPRAVFDGDGESAFAQFVDPGVFAIMAPASDQPAMFLYTSGSSGTPKAVILSHRSHRWVLRMRLKGQNYGNERILVAAPLYHMNGLGVSMLSIASGATLILLLQFSTADYIDCIERFSCTWATAVPPMLAMVLLEKERLARADLSSVRFIRMGSAPVGDRLLAEIKSRFKNATIANAFATTEGGPVVFGPHPDGVPTPPMSVGYKHPEVDMKLLDEKGEPANIGVLHYKCPGVMLGYHQRPDIVRPLTPDGYLVTGDIFQRDADGFYFFVGRSDDMFVSGGENIIPSDVEHILESHPAIEHACVVPVDDDVKGQKPVAFVMLSDRASLSEDQVKAFALARMPAYQHPRRVWFLQAMPLGATNKVDRKALKELARTRLHEGAA